MVSAYLHTSDVNVIVFDYVAGGAPPYTQACANVRLLGTVLGLFIIDIHVSSLAVCCTLETSEGIIQRKFCY